MDDAEFIDLVEMETRDLLTKHGYDGGTVRVVRGNICPRVRTRGSTQPPDAADPFSSTQDTIRLR